MLIGIPVFAQRGNNEALAKEYFKNAEYDKAETIYIKLYQSDPTSTDYYNKYFQCLVIQKKYNDAEKLVKKMLKRTNSYPIYFIDLGLLYDMQTEADKAKKQYEEALKRMQPDLMMLVDVYAKFTDANLYDYALRSIDKGRKLSNNPTLMSVDASKIYILQNNKQ
jgi:tetratricopeptide (TPR) repeat protein